MHGEKYFLKICKLHQNSFIFPNFDTKNNFVKNPFYQNPFFVFLKDNFKQFSRLYYNFKFINLHTLQNKYQPINSEKQKFSFSSCQKKTNEKSNKNKMVKVHCSIGLAFSDLNSTRKRWKFYCQIQIIPLLIKDIFQK